MGIRHKGVSDVLGRGWGVCFPEPRRWVWLGFLSVRVQDPSKYTQDELQLMKTQDIRYVLNKAQAEDKVRQDRHLALSGRWGLNGECLEFMGWGCGVVIQGLRSCISRFRV